MHNFDSTRDALSQGLVAVILVAVFAGLALDRVHRVLVPVGAVALVWLISYFTPFRLISFEASTQAVDLNVILLLSSMMALVGVLKTTNVFPWAVDRLLERSRGNPSRAAILIIWFTGILSALLDNVTTVIFTYPMASEMARRLRINGSAFFLPMVMAANIGGTATLIGDPPNVLIGADPRSALSFMDFIYNLAVPCTFMMMALVWFSRRRYADDIGPGADRDRASAATPTGAQLINVPLLRATCWITVGIFAGFMTHTLTHMPVSVPAVIGVALILFAQDYYYLREHKPTPEERQHGVLSILEKDIEWPTLAFFLFLFVLVGAAVATGLIDTLALGLGQVIDGVGAGLGLSPRATLLVAALIVLWVSGVLSAVIDNIPYTAVTIPLVASLLQRLEAGADGQILWWALALGACLGGNGTLIGASANVTVTGLAEKEGKRISFNEFTAFGARVTAITLLISSLYLALWLYFGSIVVNIAGAIVLVAVVVVALLRMKNATDSRKDATSN
ncbi:MAG: sodium:proton antiporter [Proteobacteria bacterium]|nr:sodium:proton antiporter [Pseudomonadota bacterium]